MHYLDYAATTPVPAEVAQAIDELFGGRFIPAFAY